MSAEKRKYAFNWDLIGCDLDKVRPNLGNKTRVEIYRLFQFAIRDAIEQYHGTAMADKLFLEAGVISGRAFYNRYCSEVTDIASLVKVIQKTFEEMGMGIVRIEKSDTETLSIQLTVDEDLDCSGLPDTSDHICIYDEGLIKGILESYTGQGYTVREIDCWCSGARTCRFAATVNIVDE